MAEILHELEYHETQFAEQLAAGAEDADADEGSQQQPELEAEEPTNGKLIKLSGKKARKKHRKEKPGMFIRPDDPRAPTRHLYIVNAGPKFGKSAENIRLELSKYGEVSTVVVPDPNLPSVYASCSNLQTGKRLKEMFDRRMPGSVQLCGRPVVVDYAEVFLPVVPAAILHSAAGVPLTPAEMLQRVQRALLAASESDEAGNIPTTDAEKPAPPVVRCPLCSGSENLFKRGRALRMHLVSPVHRLTDELLVKTILLADANAGNEFKDDFIRGNSTVDEATMSNPGIDAAARGDLE